MYVYIYSKDGYGGGLYTVGFYSPSGEWVPESDHATPEDAASRVAWLNGSPSLQARSNREVTESPELMLEQLGPAITTQNA